MTTVQLKVWMHPLFRSSMEKLLDPKAAHKASVARLLNKIQDKMQVELAAYEKVRIDTLKKYCNKDENGNPVIIPADSQGSVERYDIPEGSMEAFSTELNELLESVIDDMPRAIGVDHLNIELTREEVAILYVGGVLCD